MAAPLFAVIVNPLVVTTATVLMVKSRVTVLSQPAAFCKTKVMDVWLQDFAYRIEIPAYPFIIAGITANYFILTLFLKK